MANKQTAEWVQGFWAGFKETMRRGLLLGPYHKAHCPYHLHTEERRQWQVGKIHGQDEAREVLDDLQRRYPQ